MFTTKGEEFYCRGIQKLPETRENVQQAMEHTFNKAFFIILLNITYFFRKKNSHIIFVHLVYFDLFFGHVTNFET